MKQKKRDAYLDYVEKKSPTTKFFPSILWAFLVGGLICCIGQGIGDIAKLIWPNLSKIDVSAISSAMLIFIASFLTGIGVYDRIGAFAGAGSIVPITGFSNSVSAAAMEFKNEGFIFGMSAKMFVVAGPVIVNGVVIGVVIGLIYLIFGL